MSASGNVAVHLEMRMGQMQSTGGTGPLLAIDANEPMAKWANFREVGRNTIRTVPDMTTSIFK